MPTGVREVLSFDAGYETTDGPRTCSCPSTSQPPYQLVVFFPGVGPFVGRRRERELQPVPTFRFTRAAARSCYPVFKGRYERWDNFLSLQGDEYLSTFRTRMGQWRQDLGRTLDVLVRARRTSIMSRIGVLRRQLRRVDGVSADRARGALQGRHPRSRRIHLSRDFRRKPTRLNYLSRVTMPVLMMGGRHDYIFPLETSQKPMFDRLGTPADRKRHVVYEAGHGNFPRGQVITEVLGWLDRYLGPVTVQKAPAR